jgi:hypothetical protein
VASRRVDLLELRLLLLPPLPKEIVKVPARHPMDYRETAVVPTCPARVTGPGNHSLTPFVGVSVHGFHHAAVGVSVHGPVAGPGPVHFGVVGVDNNTDVVVVDVVVVIVVVVVTVEVVATVAMVDYTDNDALSVPYVPVAGVGGSLRWPGSLCLVVVIGGGKHHDLGSCAGCARCI